MNDMVNSEEKILNKKNFWVIVINSMVFFLLAYLFIYFIAQLATVVTSSMFDIDTIIYYYRVYYDIDKTQWDFDSVKGVFSAGPIAALFFAIIFLIIYSKVRETDGLLKLFFLWGYLIGFTFFFGSFFLGTVFNRGFGYVLTWSYVMDTGRMFFLILSFIVLIIIGYMSTKSFLFSANSYFNSLNETKRKFFVHSQLTVPYFLGIAIIFLIKIPNNSYNNYYELFQMLSMLIIIIPILLRYNSYQTFYFEENPKTINIGRGYLIFLIVVIFLFRFGLSFGLRF